MVSVAVVGGGPAGCAVAIHLVRAGIDVALFERRTGVPRRIGELFPAEAIPLLRELGIDRTVLTSGAHKVPRVASVWGSSSTAHRPSFALASGSLDRALIRQARAEGVAVHLGVDVVRVESFGSGVRLQLRLPRRRSVAIARFVVDASGRSARVARAFGAEPVFDDRLIAVARRSRMPRASRTLTLETCAEGWWGVVPYAADRAGVLHVCDAMAVEGRALRDAWVERFNASSARLRSNAGNPYGECIVRDASTRVLSSVAGDAWLAVGDAAFACDPLSGDGIVRGIRLARQASRAVRGLPSAKTGYCSAIEELRHTYVSQRASFYALESRWSDQPFWRARSPHAGPLPDPQSRLRVRLRDLRAHTAFAGIPAVDLRAIARCHTALDFARAAKRVLRIEDAAVLRLLGELHAGATQRV